MKPIKAVAAGDSWLVHLPFHLGTGGGLANSLFGDIMHIPFTNLAHAGDSSEESMGTAMATKLEAALPGADVLLWSSGGDDFAGDEFEIFIDQNDGRDPSLAINMDRFQKALDVTMMDYERLVELRDRIAPNCLIVTHDYDYPVAARMGVGVLGFIGPWLKPSLDYCGWHDVEKQVEIVQIVLRAFASELMIFSRSNRLHLHVHTQGTLGADDWDNEIHANAAGWTKLAQVVNAALLPHLMAMAGPSPGSCGPESAD